MLVSALADAVPDHVVLEEPYHALEAIGHTFANPPGVEDFEAQLELSIESVQNTGADVIFDRCPADFLAYLAEKASPDAMASYWTRAERAMALLDLVIYVPVERPDRIHVPGDEFPSLRKRVDRRLRQFLREGELLPSARTREVLGSVPERVRSVLVAIESSKA